MIHLPSMNNAVFIPAAEICARSAASRAGGLKGPGQRGFTLVELLSVMAIILLLLCTAVPAFKGIGSASRINAVGNQLADLASLARQNSLSRNCLSALILLTDTGPTGTRQSLAVFQLLPRADGAVTSAADWTQITGWQALPAGVCVDVALTPSPSVANDPSCTFLDAASQNFDAPTSLPASLNYDGHAVSTYKFVIFLAGGGLLNGNAARAELVEGTLPPAAHGTTPRAVYTHPLLNSAGPVLPANYYRITLVPATGRVKIDRP